MKKGEGEKYGERLPGRQTYRQSEGGERLKQNGK